MTDFTQASNFAIRYKLTGTTSAAQLADSGSSGSYPLTSISSLSAALGHGGTASTALYSGGGTGVAASMTTNSTIPYSATFSAAIWVKPATGLATGTWNIFTDDFATGKRSWRIDIIYSGGAWHAQALVFSSSAEYTTFLVGATALTLGNWYHLAFTVDSSKIIRLYVNGVLDGTSSAMAYVPYNVGTGNHQLCVGMAAIINNGVNATFDDACLFTSTLSGTDIAALYTYGDDFKAPPPVFIGSGGIVLGGHGIMSYNAHFVGAGGMVLGGHGLKQTSQTFTGRGGIIFGGAGRFTFGNGVEYIGVGGIVLGGKGNLTTSKSFAGHGGIVFGGHGISSFTVSANLEQFVTELFDVNGVPITGAAPVMSILRYSDGALYDFSSSSFKTSGWGVQAIVMSQINPSLAPLQGRYKQVVDLAPFNDGTYLSIVAYAGTPAQNFSAEFKIYSGRVVEDFTANEAIAINSDVSENLDVAVAVQLNLTTVLADIVDIDTRIIILEKLAMNNYKLDPSNGTITIYDNDDVTVLYTGLAYSDAAGTVLYNGTAPVTRTTRLS